MDLILNEKIGFGRYPGFSLLFDNPSQNSFSSMGQQLVKINCQVETDPRLIFYKCLKNGLNELGLEELFAAYRFFALPSQSYHLTVCDGLNQENLDDQTKHLVPTDQLLLEEFLYGLPMTLCQSNPFTAVAMASPLIQSGWNITYEFDELTNWGGKVLVARLKPKKGDPQSQKQFRRIKKVRDELYNQFEDKFYPGADKKSAKPNKTDTKQQRSYNPHISLGYFGNIQRGDAAQKRIDRWTEIFKKHTKNRTITFNKIGLYGFTDMATFFKQ